MAPADLAARIIELEAQLAELERELSVRGEGAILQTLMADIAKRQAVEEELRAANEWLHLAQEAGSVAAYSFDLRTHKLLWSRSTKSLYGFPADAEPTLEGWLAAIHPDDREGVQAVAEAAIAHGRDVDQRFRIVRGGDIYWIQDRARVQLGRDGGPAKLLGINVDVTELVNLQRQSAENEQRLRLAMQAEQIACWDWDLTTGAVTWDETLPRFAGLKEEFGGSFESFWELVHEDDRALVRAALDAALAGDGDYEVSFRMVRSDGGIRRTQTRAVIIRDDDGRPLRMVGVDHDITDRFSAEQQLQIFNSELHHRLKNNLATVQALVRTTLSSSPDLATFEKTFSQRLDALATTYELLRRGGASARLADLINAEIAPYASIESRLSVSGPDVLLSSERAIALGMIMHELTTNSCKYGSLSVPEGALEVRWSLDQLERGSQLSVDWIESGGPPVQTPSHQGFGSKLLQRLVTRQLNGSVSREWKASGLTLRIVCPLG